MRDTIKLPRKQRFGVWIKQAKFDLDAAQVSLENGFPEWAAYQAEQAVEKALKAIIMKSGMNPPRIHKLQVLIGMANDLNETFRNTKLEFRHIESLTFITRYPFLIPGKDEAPHELISRQDAESAIKQSVRLVEQIDDILHGQYKPEGQPIAQKEEFYTEAEIEQRLQLVKDALVREFTPERIILFGRFARNHHVPKPGTMDVLVIADTDASFVERIVKARTATKGSLPVIEPLVYTPAEFKLMTEEEGESFLENAVSEGKVIYEA